VRGGLDLVELVDPRLVIFKLLNQRVGRFLVVPEVGRSRNLLQITYFLFAFIDVKDAPVTGSGGARSGAGDLFRGQTWSSNQDLCKNGCRTVLAVSARDRTLQDASVWSEYKHFSYSWKGRVESGISMSDSRMAAVGGFAGMNRRMHIVFIHGTCAGNV